MFSVLAHAASFVALILFGYLMKKLGFCGAKDYRLLTKLLMNLTIPAAVVVSFSTFSFSPGLLFLAGMGLLLDLFMALLGWAATRGKDNTQRSFAMLNLSGYNVGAFALPYLQSFLGASGVGVACIFDVGNSVMCTGGVYAMTSAMVPAGGEKLPLRKAVGKLFSSTTFDVYLIMFLLSVLGIGIPQVVVDFLSPASAANPCIAMLMIGLMMEWELKPGYLRQALWVIAVRNLVAAAGALLFYFFAPFSLEVRQVAAIILFAPISVMATAFSEKTGTDPGLAGFVSSLSILVSFFTMTLTAVLLGISG